MSKCLSRDQYYSNPDLQNLFSKLGIEEKEVISHEFDDILKLVERRFRKLSPKYHPDKNLGNEEQAKKEFQKLNSIKQKLEEYIKVLREGKGLNHYSNLLQREKEARQEKINMILSCRDRAIKGAMIYFVLANILLDSSSQIEFCLSQFTTGGMIQNVAYQFYLFSLIVWPLLFLIFFIPIYIQANQVGSQEENLDRFNRRFNLLITADNCIICVAAALAVCSLVSEVMQNGWPAQYGTALMINLALDLLLLALTRTFVEASELYSSHCVQRLYKNDVEFNYKEKFAWYDYKLLFMPIVLPLVKGLFQDFIEEKEQRTTTTDPNVTPANSLLYNSTTTT